MRQVYTTGGPGFNQINGGMTPVVKNLLIITIVTYFVQFILDSSLTPVIPHPDAPGRFSFLFGFSWEWFSKGCFWQPITYAFLHGGPLHLIFNMMMLFFIGPETERSMGPRHFLALYFISALLGGLGWLLINSSGGSICLGASGCLFGVLAGFATLYPTRPLTILLFMITLKAKTLVAIIILVELIFMVSAHGNIAHSAHLAGALAGYVYISIVFVPNRARWTQWLKSLRQPKLTVLRNEPRSKPPSTAHDIDAVLDKISKLGVGSLTKKERAILEEASKRKN